MVPVNQPEEQSPCQAPLWSPTDWIAAAVLALVLTLPFLDKPIHIDDPVALRVAENILADPADPFAGEMDWFGHNLPLWEVTTNPPLLSYWLAGPLALFGASETALHLFMVPFLAALVLGMRRLSRRFTARAWLPTLFVAFSPAFLVSINLMRDVPAAALLCLGFALFVEGTDREDRRLLLAGALACGLAAVTKYSAAAAFPVLAGYTLWRRPRLVLWSFAAAAPLAVWCLHTWIAYGWIHPLYLMSGAHPNRTANPADQFLAGLAIVGSGLYLAPALAAAAWRRATAWEPIAACGAALAGVWLYRGAFPGPQQALWTVAGTIVLWAAFRAALARGVRDPDACLLAAWAAAFLAFSVLLAPFQAVRHLLPALPPLTLLAFRFLDQGGGRSRSRGGNGPLAALLALQLAMAVAVNLADSEYASVYRDFAATYRPPRQDGGQTWFVGHWGWMHYARRAGFRQLHRDGPLPQDGDFLIWPERVHIGDALQGRGEIRQRLELVDEAVYPGSISLRTMNFQCAAFYATIRGNLPYCWQDLPLERFRVFRWKSRPDRGVR